LVRAAFPFHEGLKPMFMNMLEKIRAQVKRLPHPVRWAVVLVLGGLAIAAGLVMLILPGPGIVFLGIGFAILAIEFTWAEVILHKATTQGRRLAAHIGNQVRRTSGTDTSIHTPHEGPENDNRTTN